MKHVYLDADFRCHLSLGDGLQPIETSYFDGCCDEYIEGYRYIPAGATWVRSDGMIFQGEMIAPWRPWEELDAAQREYEREQYKTLATQNAELVEAMAAMVEDIYNQDIAEIEGE